MNLVSFVATAIALMHGVDQTALSDNANKKGLPKAAPTVTAVLRIAVTGCKDQVITIQDGKPFAVVMTNEVTKAQRADPAAMFRTRADLNATPHIVVASGEVQLNGMSHILLATKGFSGASRFTYTGEALRVGGQPILGHTGRPGGREIEMRIVVERVDEAR